VRVVDTHSISKCYEDSLPSIRSNTLIRSPSVVYQRIGPIHETNIVFEVPAQAQLQKDKEWLVVVCSSFVVVPPCTTLRQKIIVQFVTHDSPTRRRLDAVDADMLPVLWLSGSASAEKGTRSRPRSRVLHTLVSRVERLQQHRFQTCT